MEKFVNFKFHEIKKKNISVERQIVIFKTTTCTKQKKIHECKMKIYKNVGLVIELKNVRLFINAGVFVPFGTKVVHF